MLRILIASILFAVSAQAADVAGEWSGTGTYKNEKKNFYFVFLQYGTTLNGSGGSGMTDQNVIQNGKIDGDKVSFDLFPDGGVVLHFELVDDGTCLKGTLQLQDGHKTAAGTVELKKDKS